MVGVIAIRTEQTSLSDSERSVSRLRRFFGDKPALNVAEGDGPRYAWLNYAGGLLMVALVTAFCWSIKEKAELINIGLLYQLPVLMSAFWWGRWPSYFTALCGVMVFDFFFVPPIFALTIVDDLPFLWSFVCFLMVAYVFGGRTERLRAEAVGARQREKSTRALYEFSREIAAIIDLDVIAQVLTRQVADTINRPVLVLLPGPGGKLLIRAAHNPRRAAASAGANQEASLPETEAAAADWVFIHGQAAGASTDKWPEARFLYAPLGHHDHIVGVMAVAMTDKIQPNQRQLIDAWAALAAIAIERVKLTEKAREAALLLESDRLRTALFNSISHELRTPLSSIIGSVSTLVESDEVYSRTARRELLETMKDGAARMERVVTNLLDSARLESGMARLKMDWCDAEDLVGAALRRLGDSLNNVRVKVAIMPGTPLLKADFVLLEQVLVNLIDNAIKYSSPGCGVVIVAKAEGGMVEFSVADCGVGIPEEHLRRVFDKFYRVQQPKAVTGTGLGLSICRGIVEAHGGSIWADGNPGGGTVVSFTIPVAAGENSLQREAGG